MPRVLLVGGSGFIGRRAAQALLSLDVTPRIFDLPDCLQQMPVLPGCETIEGDVTDQRSLALASECVDGMIHLAGMMTLACERDPRRAIELNVKGSLNVFEAARAAGASVAYLSSAGVFGPSDAVHPQPLTLYGVTKLAMEGIARVYAADYGIASVGLRPYVVYGPGESSGIAAGPSMAIAAALRQEAATIRFSGRVGFVYVDDVARLLAAAMTRPIQGATVLTMAGDTREMVDFTAALAARTGWTNINVEGPPLRIPSDLKSDPVPTWLGKHPPTSIEDGIEASITALRDRK
ncbi:nucleoside-diphosphate-sugar epimerase [Sinorhizobium terangae]|uniref:NAD-dependent epimerase/dehydratase family protein n=1 Tax=Sinorhizobium terangae TaxID=110322 RepID=A0A6N7LK13_SINTE|nr:NAD(P)-dependent oxidoreductase [Sinorhizobium terangae]MBB4188533.1 nucleoside-diphosphate-sugar epimerase [Sinorhizobium terangae]MQX18142.1 NAD-dependent epimerase/dehydratase family protein [Sinorhizobium terangae]